MGKIPENPIFFIMDIIIILALFIAAILACILIWKDIPEYTNKAKIKDILEMYFFVGIIIGLKILLMLLNE